MVFSAVAFIVGIVTLIYLLFKWKYAYWAKLGLQTPRPFLFFGNTYDVFAQKASFGENITAIYNEMKSKGLKHCGMYMLLSPIYVPLDPELIKRIMQTDFQHFIDRGLYFNEEDDPLSAHLVSLEGQKWKNLRAKLTPTFTSGKMKMMFWTVLETSNQLVAVLDERAVRGPLEIKDVLARLTTDIIGSCAFGIDCNSLKNPDAEFRMYGRKVFEVSVWEQLPRLLSIVAPDFMRSIRYKLIPADVSRFFMKAVKDTIAYRESTKVERKDFMHLLLQLKNEGKLDDNESAGKSETVQGKLTLNELAAQAFVFFVAGFETSSTTMSYCLYELALQQDIQEKLRKEINEVLDKFNGQLSYEALGHMRYMDMVVDETLRKYPPLFTLNRKCTRDYDVPGSNVRLKKGTSVLIPFGAVQNDPQYHPDPDKFDPERFSQENKSKMRPYTYLPFGEGPRICIGIRFGLMQVKVGLSVLLKNYKFTLNQRTPIPLKMNPANLLTSPLGGIWVDVEKICAIKN